MLLKESYDYLNEYQPSLLQMLKLWEKERSDNNNVFIEDSRKNASTLKVNIAGQTRYILSKYDPMKEAERLVSQINVSAPINHVLFIGIGLGYHIAEFHKRYPEMKISIYEPNIEVLYQFFANLSVKILPLKKVEVIFAGIDKGKISQSITAMHQTNGKKTLVFTLPAYAKLYEYQEKVILETMKEIIGNKKINMNTRLSFQKRWTINSIKNFPYVLQTPNIFHDINQSSFKNKTVIIVAAGPSLSEEFDNLKYIKENKLAYIFSVGSALNALIEHDIYPDATFSYDPTEINQMVIKKIKDKNIKNIPLVYGSSVGFETLEDYPGKMLHMITSQDSISPIYLDTSKNIDIVLDAPSIAVVTFQATQILGFNQVIIVGQNLSYLGNKKYSKGINYDFINNEVSEDEQSSLVSVKDVYGNEVYTTKEFNMMRNQLELYIKMHPEIKVINTTKGGAHIVGTTFLKLSNVIKEKLTTPVVNSNWFEGQKNYSLDYVNQRKTDVEEAKYKYDHILENAMELLKEIDACIKIQKLDHLEKKFAKFDSEFIEIKRNIFFQAYIEPMLSLQNEILAEESESIRFEKSPSKKGKLVVKSFGKFLSQCQEYTEFISPFYQELHTELNGILL
jgi:hypothetical protein